MADQPSAAWLPSAAAFFPLDLLPARGALQSMLVRKRPILFAPLFLGSILFVRPVEQETLLEIAAFTIAIASWALRVWAMGYRTWVRGGGTRHLLRSGPYAHVRHPRYVANFFAGSTWFLLVADPACAIAYALLYGLILWRVIASEEEKLARDYPGFDEWRREVPAVIPRLRPRRPADAEPWELATVVRGKEPWKLLGLLLALGALATARRTGIAFLLLARVLSHR